MVNGNFEKGIKTIKEQEETLSNEQLESTAGGATECTCDCWIGNSNNTPDQKKNVDKEVDKDLQSNG